MATDYERFVVSDGESITLASGTYYNAREYSGNGAAGDVQAGGTLTGSTITLFGNTALSTRSADSRGGAVINAGTATFEVLNGVGNVACYGGAFANSGTLTVKSDFSFTSNVAEDSGGAILNQETCIFVDGGTFARNGANYIGGAICNQGEFSVGDVLFDGNTATQKGGAIYTEGELLFTGTALFVNNYSQSGGAIYSTGNVSLTGGTFCGNGAYGHGGAIFNGGTMSLQDVDFSRNLNLSDTLSSGAAIYNTGVITVSNADFTGNSSSRGGAVCNAGGTFTLTDAVFRGNGGSWSGAICNTDGGTFTLIDVLFDANNASRMGGAISNSYNCAINMIGGTICDNNEGVSNYGTASFTNVLFAGNHSDDLSFGAGIYNNGYAAVNGGTFCENSGSYGAGFRNYGNMWVANSLFCGNIGGNGTGLCNDSSIELVSNTFCNNRATGYGGAIFNGNSITISDCLLQENQATYGGAICNIASGLKITDAVVFRKNSATQGGAIYNQYRGMTISGATFSENTAVNEGGAIYAISGSVTISSTTFSENTSSKQGGAIYTKAGTFTLADVTFDNNRAPQQQGGAIYNEAGTISLAGSVSLLTFRDTIYNGGTFNWSVVQDDAGYLNDYTLLENDGKLCITVDQDVAGTKILAGNAVSAEGETFTLKGIGGEASITVGGGSVVYGGITFQLSVVDGSLVLESGKEYYRIVVKDGETESLVDVTYHNPLVYARSGGAGEVRSGGTLTGERLLFTGNVISAKSELGGGALYNAGTLTLRNTTFDQNGVAAQMATAKSYAPGKGGALFNDGGVAELTDVVFSANTVAGGNNAYGGAICNQSGTVNLTNAEFTGNMGFYGGALYNKDGVVTATGATFCNNSGYGYSFSYDPQGGAVYNQSGTITLTDVVFIGNTASYCGALFNTGGVVNVTGGTFCNNIGYRYDSCGAIYNNKTLTLSDVTFSGNYGARGGAIGNYGTLNLTGNVQLLSASDTIYNGGTINWDFSNGDAAYLDNFALLNNLGALFITVDAGKEQGKYAISGNVTDVEKVCFTLTGMENFEDVVITGASAVNYANSLYQFECVEGELFLTVSDLQRFVATKDDPVEPVPGKVYATVPYYGNGGAGEIRTEGRLTATTDVVFDGNTAKNLTETSGGYGGAFCNYGYVSLADAGIYRNSAETAGGAIANFQTIDLNGQVFFSTNSAALGGAVYNEGVINVKNSITLVTESDTWVNQGGENTYAVTNWDLRNAPQGNVVCLNDYQYFSNVGSKACETITVNAYHALGHYTIATGDLSDVSGKDTFQLTLDGTSYSTALVADGAAVTYQGRMYMLGIYETSLIVSVYESQRFVATSLEPVMLEAGKTYSNTLPYYGNGGAGEVQIGGVLTAAGEVAFVADAVQKKGTSDSGKGGALINQGTAQLQKTTFQYNSADFGGAIYNVGNFTFTDTATFIRNASRGSGGAVDNYSWLTMQKDASIVLNYAFQNGGAIDNHGHLVLNDAVFYGNEAVKNGGAIHNDQVIDVTGNVSFSGNTAALGGAVYNESLIHLTGVVTLITDSDTWINCGNENSFAITNWDLRNAENGYSVRVNNFEHFSNVGEKTRQTITVEAEQKVGNYIVATGSDLSDLAGKDSFLITLDNAAYSDALIVGSAALSYQDRYYQLGVDKTELILTISDELIDEWNFNCTECELDFAGTNFADDTLNVDTSALVDSWTLLAGDAGCIACLGDAASVTFDGKAATWNGVAWSDGTFELSTNEEKKFLVVSKLA